MAFHSPTAQAQASFQSTGAVVTSWNPVDRQDEQVIKAAKFALQEQSRQTPVGLTLLTIKHARLQVMAGNHYSMNLMVQTEGKKRLVIAVVWTKPDGKMELTRWHWV